MTSFPDLVHKSFHEQGIRQGHNALDAMQRLAKKSEELDPTAAQSPEDFLAGALTLAMPGAVLNLPNAVEVKVTGSTKSRKYTVSPAKPDPKAKKELAAQLKECQTKKKELLRSKDGPIGTQLADLETKETELQTQLGQTDAKPQDFADPMEAARAALADPTATDEPDPNAVDPNAPVDPNAAPAPAPVDPSMQAAPAY
jgi:hypothetical protein